MIKPVKKAKNELLALAEELKPTARGWFALLPPDIASELTEARDAIKSGKSTATMKGLWKTACKLYPKHVNCSHSAFRTWYSNGE